MTNYDKFVAKSSTHCECKICDYITSRKSNFEKHVKTNKHNELHNDDIDKIENNNICSVRMNIIILLRGSHYILNAKLLIQYIVFCLWSFLLESLLYLIII